MHATRHLIAHLPFPVLPWMRRRCRQFFDLDVWYDEYGSAALASFAHRGTGHSHRLLENGAARFVQNAAHHDVRPRDIRLAGWLLYRFIGDI